ncbi:MAG: inositol monophosphatase family protein [Phycisphaerales bacterium]|jgi:histidinol-phosphatase
MFEVKKDVAPEVRKRLKLALEAAHAAGEVTLGYFQGDQLGTRRKEDGSPVTRADTEAEQTLRTAIAEAFPRDDIVGEEFGQTLGKAGGRSTGGDAFRWVLDPIDGTVSFVHGVPLYGVLVGVFQGESPVAGVVHMPALGETVYAALDGGAWWVPGPKQKPRPARVSDTDRLRDAMVVTTGLEYFAQIGAEKLYAGLSTSCGRIRGWSDCYAHVLLATGRCDAVVEPSIKVWDIAPLPSILGELGGVVSDWHGEHHLDSGHAIASNGHVHGELLSVVRGAVPRTDRDEAI